MNTTGLKGATAAAAALLTAFGVNAMPFEVINTGAPSDEANATLAYRFGPIYGATMFGFTVPSGSLGSGAYVFDGISFKTVVDSSAPFSATLALHGGATFAPDGLGNVAYFFNSAALAQQTFLFGVGQSPFTWDLSSSQLGIAERENYVVTVTPDASAEGVLAMPFIGDFADKPFDQIAAFADSAPVPSYSNFGYEAPRYSFVVTADDKVVTTPVPEPETYVMMLAGLGLVGLAARRRKGSGTPALAAA